MFEYVRFINGKIDKYNIFSLKWIVYQHEKLNNVKLQGCFPNDKKNHKKQSMYLFIFEEIFYLFLGYQESNYNINFH